MKVIEFLFDKGGDCDRYSVQRNEEAVLGTLYFGAAKDQPGIIVKRGNEPQAFYPLSRIVWIRYQEAEE